MAISQEIAAQEAAQSQVIADQVIEAVQAAEAVVAATANVSITRPVPRAKAKEGFPTELKAIFLRPLPLKAISQGTRGMSSIKGIYISERLNEAFGEGRWYTKAERIERIEGGKTGINIVAKVNLYLHDYPWFYAESVGGHENADLGDSYKGAVTDALSKICAVQFGIAIDVYKGNGADVSARFEKDEAAAATAAAKATPAEVKDAKAAATAVVVATAQALVANSPDCADCLLIPGKSAKIKTWEHPNKKRYDAADLIKQSQKNYKLNLCGDCLAARATALKNAASRQTIQ